MKSLAVIFIRPTPGIYLLLCFSLSQFALCYCCTLPAQYRQQGVVNSVRVLCKGLPTLAPGKEYRYHNETGTCHVVGDRGPCREDQRFKAQNLNDDVGQCSCIQKETSVYWPQDGKCYNIYTRGPCSERQLIVYSATKQPECQTYECPSSNGTRYVKWTDGKCYEYETMGPCKEGMSLAANLNTNDLDCFRDSSNTHGVAFVEQECPPGKKRPAPGSPCEASVHSAPGCSDDGEMLQKGC